MQAQMLLETETLAGLCQGLWSQF